MEPTQKMIDEDYREKVLRARARPIEQKIFAGAILFEEECEQMRMKIRANRPECSESEILEILRQQVEQLHGEKEFVRSIDSMPPKPSRCLLSV